MEGTKTVIEKIKRRRVEWFGHVERMEGKRLPNAALRVHGHVSGYRIRGRQRKRWMGNVREDLEERKAHNYLWHREKPRIEKS